MITPIELQSKTFKTGLGYDKKEVESFLHSLLNDYETLYKDNMELNDKVNVLTEGINYYKGIEKTLQKALVLAEKTAEDTKAAAIKQARAIEEEARTKAQLIVADANHELQRLQLQIKQLVMQYDSYKAQFKHLAAAQCEFLDSESFQLYTPDFDSNTETMESSTNYSRISNQNMDVRNDTINDSSEQQKEYIPDNESEEDFEFYDVNEDE